MKVYSNYESTDIIGGGTGEPLVAGGMDEGSYHPYEESTLVTKPNYADNDVIAMQKIIDHTIGIDGFSYPMNKNAPRPLGEYAAVMRPDSSRIGYPNRGYKEVVNNKGQVELWEIIKSLRNLDYYILFSRDDDEIMLFEESIGDQSTRDLSKKLGYAITRYDRVKVEDITFETNWEVRSAIKVEANTVRVRRKLIECIENVEVEGTFYSEGKEYALKVNTKE